MGVIAPIDRVVSTRMDTRSVCADGVPPSSASARPAPIGSLGFMKVSYDSISFFIFGWSPTADAMDFYERGLFNHILPSQDPETGMVIYYCPLRPGAWKSFSTPEDSFWCCLGTGMENHTKYGDTIYFHDDHSLYVNLFIPSELTWREKGIALRQEMRFPEEEAIH